MTKSRYLTSLLIMAAFWSEAAPFNLTSLKVGPVVYSNITIVGANVTDLYFTHANGIGNVKLKYLNADLQKRFGFNAKAAAEAERKQSEADTLYQSTLVSNMAYVAKQAQAAQARATNVVEAMADPISDKSLLGKAAPPLEIEKWSSDKPDTEGKYVLVGFWAPWSAASTNCLPELNSLQKKFAKKLVVIGVSPTEPDEAPKVDFVCATDTKAKYSAAAGVASIPSVLLVDTKGIVRYQGHPAAITEKKLEAFLAQAVE